METLEKSVRIINETPMETRKFHPVKFVVWLLMIGSGMLFMAFTSALIVSKADGIKNNAWLEYDIPLWFTVSTLVVVVTSILIHFAYNQIKKDNSSKATLLMALTMVGGVVFIISQIKGYEALVDAGIYFSNQEAKDIAGSFFYVITGAHLVHILLGLAILFYTFIQLIRKKISASKSIMMYVATFYWHFLGFLWIYLFLLLNLTR